jgi:oligopeptide/dipeptide ABC transporter ATP-binding protein
MPVGGTATPASWCGASRRLHQDRRMSVMPRLAAEGVRRHYPLQSSGLFSRRRGLVRAVEDVYLTLMPDETLALVGESGCGKSTLARSLALLEPPTAGTIRLDGQDVTRLGRRALRPLRRRVQMIFQDPYGSLNPRLPAGTIIAEPLVIHGIGDRPRRVAALADAVGIPAAHLDRYPHQFSGGQRQRIAIARALALEPDVVVADEPVSALDVSIRSQILNLMADLRAARGLSYLFISHDLSVVRHVADRVAVMYLGRIVETASVARLFADPRHPYTRTLLAAAPQVGRGKRRPGRIASSDVPSPIAPPAGCPFHPRCSRAEDICRQTRPELEPVAAQADQHAACHFRDEAPNS